MDENLIREINSGTYKFYAAITGGGTSFISEYLKISGASKVFLGANVPYSHLSFTNFTKCKVDSHASEEGARKLALASYREALAYGGEKEKSIGIGASCSIATENERAGRKHKIYLAFHKQDLTYTVSRILNQSRTRDEEENMISELILKVLNDLSKNTIRGYIGTTKTPDGEELNIDYAEDSKILELIIGETLLFTHKSSLSFLDKEIVLYPGSFNPLTEAHRTISQLSSKILGKDVTFELCINNAEKGYLDYIDIKRRRWSLSKTNYIISNASLARDKVSMIRKFNKKPLFLICGWDTWARIWDKKYCLKNSLMEEFNFFLQNDVRFLVFARNGTFVPHEFAPSEDLRIKIDIAENFRMDISSSQIRKSLHEKI